MDGHARPRKSFPRRIPAESWNDALDAGKDWGERRVLGEGDRPHVPLPIETDLVNLKNSSGASLPSGSVLQVDAAILTTIDRQHLWLDGLEPAPDGTESIAICTRPHPADHIQQCQVSGVCLALVNVTHIQHKWADIDPGTTVLQSHWHGRCEILWREGSEGLLVLGEPDEQITDDVTLTWDFEGNGQQQAIVRIGSMFAGPIRAKADEIIAPDGSGAVTIWTDEPAESDPISTEVAYLDWITCDRQVEVGEELELFWRPRAQHYSIAWRCGDGGTPPEPLNPCADPCPCCFPITPPRMHFVLSGITGEEACCSALNGEYTLARDPAGGCRWVLCEIAFCEYQGIDLNLHISLRIVSGADADAPCECTSIIAEVSLLHPTSGDTYLYMLWKKDIEFELDYDSDCCLISEVLELECFRGIVCDTEDLETIPTARVCGICDAIFCLPCGDDATRFMVVNVQGIEFGNCSLCDLLNTQHVLFQVAGQSTCFWSEQTRVIDNCEATFSLIADVIDSTLTWFLTLTMGPAGDPPQTATWTGTSGNCLVTNLSLTTSDTPTDCDISGATVTISSTDSICVGLQCCKEPDRVNLKATFLSTCEENLDGVEVQLPFVPDMGIHNQWDSADDIFVCINGVGGSMRLVCTDGQYVLTLRGSASSGCSWTSIKLTPSSVQCDPFQLVFDASIFDTGVPIGCECCDELGFPIAVQIVITLADAPAAALTLPEIVKVVVTKVGGIAAGTSGTAEVYLEGAATGTEIPVHANWMFGSNSAAQGAEAVAKWFKDEQKWVIIELEC